MTLRKKFVNSALTNKTCNKCGNTYPRTEDYFYRKRHHARKDSFIYESNCITCVLKNSKQWKKNNKSKIAVSNLKYLQTEKGYFKSLFHSVRKSKRGNLFNDFDEFMECWILQQQKYGEYCPYYPHIKMTRIKGVGKTTPINISTDRLVNTLPYAKDNIMFVSWKANNEKGDVSYFLARKIVDFIEEKQQLRVFVDIDTFKRNNRKFDFKEYRKIRREADDEME